MSEELPDDFVDYEDETHIYRNREGMVRPSATEVLKFGGLFNYSMVPPEKLERKRTIGSHVHHWTRLHDESGREMDDVMALYKEERGYAESYLRILDEIMPMVEWMEIEKPMLSEIGGFEIGGTPDRFLKFNQRLYTFDLKCVAGFQPGWRLQLAIYNMLRSRRSTCAAYGRATIRLMADGRKAKIDWMDPKFDPVDSAAATAFITSFVWKRNHHLI